MLFNIRFRKFLLLGAITSILALTQGAALAEQKKPTRIHVDPVSGEVTEIPKLLSEMTAAEKATLSEVELKELEKVEAEVKAMQKKEAGEKRGK